MGLFLVALVVAGVTAAASLAESSTVAVVDDFSGTLASWTGHTVTNPDDGACAINAGRMGSSGGNCSEAYTAASFPTGDVEAYMTIASASSTPEVDVRWSLSAATGYGCGYFSGTYSIYKRSPGAAPSLASMSGSAPIVGDRFMCRAVGTSIYFYKAASGSSVFTLLLTASDASYAGAYVNVVVAGYVDDFAAGSYTGGGSGTTATVTTTVATTATVTTTSPATTVTVSNAGFANCGGTTTDSLGASVDQAPCNIAFYGDSSSQIDLTWWGIWAVAGLLLAVLVAPMWARAWKWWT